MFQSLLTSIKPFSNKMNSPSRSKQTKENNELIRNFSPKYNRDKEQTLSTNFKLKALKNDILIRNINKREKLNIDIMNNPILSNRFKEKLGELLITTPSSMSNKIRFTKPNTNVKTENTNFQNREKELLSLINVDYDTIKSKKENKKSISPSRQKVNQLMKYLNKSTFLEQYKANLKSRNNLNTLGSIREDTFNYDNQFSKSKIKARHQKTKSSLI